MTVLTEDTSLTQEFVSECIEMLDLVEPQLLGMSKNIDAETFDKETVDSIFRLFHTLKGSAGFMNLSVVQSVSHEAENLLDLVRNGFRLSDGHVELLIRTTDFIRDLMEMIEVENSDEKAMKEGENLVSELAGAVKEVNGGGAAGSNFIETPPKKKGKSKKAKASRVIGKPPDFNSEFVAEAIELMEQAEQNIFELKENPDRKKVLENLFRIIHTFKGNCGFMGYGNMEKLSHGMESLVEQFQMGTLVVTEGHLDLLLSMQGILEKSLAEPSDEGIQDIGNIDIYLDILGDTLKRAGVDFKGQAKASLRLVDAPGTPEAVTSGNPPVAESQAEASTSEAAPNEDAESSKIVSLGKANGGGSTPEPADAAKPAGENPITRQSPEASSPQSEGGEAGPSISAQPEYGRRITDQQITAEPEYGRRRTDNMDSASVKHTMRQDIRVNIEKLDTMFDLVGELIIAESMVTHNPEIADHEFPSFEKAANHLTKITRELHDISMLVRMIPVSGTFQKMNRLVHDLSRKSGKAVDLTLIGEETEVDKTVVELISDPLIHLIRNSVDHGLEPAEERLAAGKSASGKITIEARHEGNEVWILVSDDGRGLDREKLIQKGIERGLVTGDGTDMKDEEVFDMIFEPGFSTAKEVTNVSGRGVGMDVVKRNIEKIKGRVDVHTEKGVGTRFIIRIPLTLAIIEGMMVRVGESDYTVPILSIKETIRVFQKQVTTTADGQEYVKIRDQIFPVLRLHVLHRLETSKTKLENGVLLVLEHQRQTFCLLVDELVGLHQTVVKGLTGFLSDVRGISGYTILGNGDVSLILDLGSLLDLAASPENQAVN